MERGIVKWYDEEKGYGFVQSDDGKREYFVHKSALVDGSSLEKGEMVEYEIGEGKKGPVAKNVRSLNE